MKKEYDFSKGERGRFFQREATLNIPVYLDMDIESWLVKQAKSQGIEVQILVNKLLRKDISLIQDEKSRKIKGSANLIYSLEKQLSSNIGS